MKRVAATGAGSKKNKRTWVVVADGGQARVLESEATHSGVSVSLDISSDARLTGGKLTSDRLPRTQESANSRRHAVEPRVSIKQHEKDLFIARLADYLKGGRTRYDELVIVAPARIAKALKAELPAPVAAKIVLTKQADMTWMGVADILKRLGPVGKQIQKQRGGV